MRILAGWDDPAEADLLHLYLAGGGDNVTCLAAGADALLAAAAAEPWDVVLQPLAMGGSAERGFEVYADVQARLPGVPIVLACRPTEIINLPRFLLRGL